MITFLGNLEVSENSTDAREMQGKSDRETCPLFASRFGLRQCLVNFYGSTFVTLLKDLFANIKTF